MRFNLKVEAKLVEDGLPERVTLDDVWKCVCLKLAKGAPFGGLCDSFFGDPSVAPRFDEDEFQMICCVAEYFEGRVDSFGSLVGVYEVSECFVDFGGEYLGEVTGVNDWDYCTVDCVLVIVLLVVRFSLPLDRSGEVMA